MIILGFYVNLTLTQIIYFKIVTLSIQNKQVSPQLNTIIKTMKANLVHNSSSHGFNLGSLMNISYAPTLAKQGLELSTNHVWKTITADNTYM